MGLETNPNREGRAERDVRLAVGRQMTRTVICCGLSLIVGVVIAHYFLRQQLQLQQGVVGQLQTEIRGLTSDIQRMEMVASSGIARMEQTVLRLEGLQRGELVTQARSAEERLASLERLVQRQSAATRTAQAACLAEFEPYRRKHLAVPVELISEALGRMTQGRTDDLQLLVEEIRMHLQHERSRLARLESQTLLGGVPAQPQTEPRTRLDGPLPGFPYAELPAKKIAASAAAWPTPLSTRPVPVALSDEPAALPTDETQPEPTPILSVQRTSSSLPEPPAEAAPALVPVPDAPPPLPRSARFAGVKEREHKPQPYLLSFSSGRRVTPDSPVTTTTKAAADQPAHPADQSRTASAAFRPQ